MYARAMIHGGQAIAHVAHPSSTNVVVVCVCMFVYVLCVFRDFRRAHLIRITTRFNFSSLGFGAISPYAMTGQQFIGLYPEAFPCPPSQAEVVHGRGYQLSGKNG